MCVVLVNVVFGLLLWCNLCNFLCFLFNILVMVCLWFEVFFSLFGIFIIVGELNWLMVFL